MAQNNKKQEKFLGYPKNYIFKKEDLNEYYDYLRTYVLSSEQEQLIMEAEDFGYKNTVKRPTREDILKVFSSKQEILALNMAYYELNEEYEICSIIRDTMNIICDVCIGLLWRSSNLKSGDESEYLESIKKSSEHRVEKAKKEYSNG